MPPTLILDNGPTEALHAEADTILVHLVALPIVDEDVAALHHLAFHEWAQPAEQIRCSQRLGSSLLCIHGSVLAVG